MKIINTACAALGFVFAAAGASSQIINYNFEGSTLLPSAEASGVQGSAFSLNNGGSLTFGAGSASVFNGPRGTAVVGSDWSDADTYFAFTVTPLSTQLNITGLSFSVIKEGSTVSPGAKIYYRVGSADPVLAGQISSFAAPSIINFDTPLGGLFYGNTLLFNLTSSEAVEIWIAQDGMPAGNRMAVDNVVLLGSVVAAPVPEASTFLFVPFCALAVVAWRVRRKR